YFFFHATSTTVFYPLSLHDALPIFPPCEPELCRRARRKHGSRLPTTLLPRPQPGFSALHPVDGQHHPPAHLQPSPTVRRRVAGQDRKSTRLNSSHLGISYAVFCLKK